MAHSDAQHPGDRADCEHCQMMIDLYGEMPPKDEILASLAGRPKSVYSKKPIPAAIRWYVWERDDFRCKHCGSRQYLTVDHIHPESKGGDLEPSNLQTLCTSCNCRKGAR